MGWYSSRGGLSRDVPLKKVAKKKPVVKSQKTVTSDIENKEPFIDLRKTQKND